MLQKSKVLLTRNFLFISQNQDYRYSIRTNFFFHACFIIVEENILRSSKLVNPNCLKDDFFSKLMNQVLLSKDVKIMINNSFKLYCMTTN